MSFPGGVSWRWASSLVLLISLAIVCPTHAQGPQQTALARTLFEEGVTLADKGNWVGAADRFARAYSLKPTFGIAFNWASALVEIGKLLEAQELLHRIVREPSADAEIKRQSEQMLDGIDKRIARIRVQVVGDDDKLATLQVDGVSWPHAAWNVTSPIDPGRHLLVLKVKDIETTRTELTLPPGDSREIVLYASGRSEEGPKPVVLQTATARDRTLAANSTQDSFIMATPKPLSKDDAVKRPLRRSWVLWSAVGAAVAGGVVAAVVLTRDRHDGDGSMANPGVIVW